MTEERMRLLTALLSNPAFVHEGELDVEGVFHQLENKIIPKINGIGPEGHIIQQQAGDASN